jgi:hypothetical protein
MASLLTLVVSEMSCVPDNYIPVFHTFAVNEAVDVFLHYHHRCGYRRHSVLQFQVTSEITVVPNTLPSPPLYHGSPVDSIGLQ